MRLVKRLDALFARGINMEEDEEEVEVEVEVTESRVDWRETD